MSCRIVLIPTWGSKPVGDEVNYIGWISCGSSTMATLSPFPAKNYFRSSRRTFPAIIIDSKTYSLLCNRFIRIIPRFLTVSRTSDISKLQLSNVTFRIPATLTNFSWNWVHINRQHSQMTSWFLINNMLSASTFYANRIGQTPCSTEHS